MVIWNALTGLWREENAARGYREVKTPILYDVDLFKTSGHWDVYREHMYFTAVEGRTMGLKPMNCPAHVQLYKDARHSYRDDFGHEEADVWRLVKELIAKWPEAERA